MSTNKIMSCSTLSIRLLHSLRLSLNNSGKRYITSSVAYLTKQEKTLEGKPYVDITKVDKVIYGAKDLRLKLQEHVGARQYWLENLETLQHIDAERAKSQDELEERKIADSVQEVIIPLGNDLAEREKYMTFYRTVRLGKLLEDMDTLAGWVGFKYFKGPRNGQRAPFSLVTACVDQIDFTENMIQSDKDIKMKGFVSWAGKSSLEITINIEQDADGDGAWEPLVDATFVMVARLLKDGTAGVVNKMKIDTAEEDFIFKRGQEHKEERIKKKAESLFKAPPTAEEREVVHQLFLGSLDPNKSTFQSRVKPEGSVWMEDTRLKNVIICHPQSRNLYNKIFGGFLMREAFELAWANTCVYIKGRPSAIRIDDILFRRPVEVGSLLYLSSQIVFTKGQYLQCRVHAEVVDPKSGNVQTTNVFHVHFASSKPVPPVMPNSYGEYMLYLDGLRHFPKHLAEESVN